MHAHFEGVLHGKNLLNRGVTIKATKHQIVRNLSRMRSAEQEMFQMDIELK